MSFLNPFKGPKGPRKSAISRTAEREFDREVKKIEGLDENTRNLHKDMKRCIEAQNAQAKSCLKMAQTLQNSHLCKEDNDFKQDVEHLAESCNKLESLAQELNSSAQKTVVDPLRKFQTIFPGVSQAIKKREQSLQEYSKCQIKVEKYIDRERTGPNVVKLEASKKALNAAREDYENQNRVMMEDMPKLHEGRIDYFQPSFQALIRSQIKYYTDSHDVYSELSKKLDEGRSGVSYTNDINQKLQEIRALSITIDD